MYSKGAPLKEKLCPDVMMSVRAAYDFVAKVKGTYRGVSTAQRKN